MNDRFLGRYDKVPNRNKSRSIKSITNSSNNTNGSNNSKNSKKETFNIDVYKIEYISSIAIVCIVILAIVGCFGYCVYLIKSSSKIHTIGAKITDGLNTTKDIKQNVENVINKSTEYMDLI